MPGRRKKESKTFALGSETFLNWADDNPSDEEQPIQDEGKKGGKREPRWGGGGDDWRTNVGGDSGGNGGWRGGGGDRGESKGEERTWPNKAPFTAFVGSLPFDTTTEQLKNLFDGSTSARIMKGSGESKGYGYVEFETLEFLKVAVGRDGESFGGRKLRIDVTEPKEGGKGSNFNAFAEDWRGSMGSQSQPAGSPSDVRGGYGAKGGKGAGGGKGGGGGGFRADFSRDAFGGAAAEEQNERPKRGLGIGGGGGGFANFSRDALGSELRSEERPERPARPAPSAFSRDEMGTGMEEKKTEEKRPDRRGPTFSKVAPTREFFGAGTRQQESAPARPAAAAKSSWEDEQDVVVVCFYTSIQVSLII